MSAPDSHVMVISHSHWDREWYKTAEAFRVHLVALVDDFLEGRATGPFLLDGQTIVLNDYLEWRPDRREHLMQALKDGVFEAGPWFVLGDNLIASGEAIVRNLLLGKSDLRTLALGDGSASPQVLYCPDSFGHPAALPLIAREFGLTMAIVWRGLGGRGWPVGDAMRWQHQSGAEVLVHHLPPEGYGDAANLPTRSDEAKARWQSLLSLLLSRAHARPEGALLALNGADHHAQQRGLDAAIAAGASAVAPVRVARASLRDFAADFIDGLADKQLEVIYGELRASPSYVWALQGTFSARAPQKRRNAQIEWGLVRDVEPWIALARWHGREFGHVLAAVWRDTLTNHPHDTLCGCSIDAVARQFDARCERVEHAMVELRTLALDALLGSALPTSREDDVPPYVQIRNPLARRFSGVIECNVDVPVGRVPVGPGSAGPTPQLPHARERIAIGEPRLPQQVLSRELLHTRIESARNYPVNLLVHRHRTLLWVNDLPPVSVRAVAIERGVPANRRAPQRVQVRGQELHNGLLTVWFDDTRGLCARDSEGREYLDILRFESVAEGGDLYTHSAVAGTARDGVLVRHRVAVRGPLRAAIAARWRVPVAACSLRSATGEAYKRKESTIQVNVRVELDAGSSVLRLTIAGNNTTCDYRLRARVRSGCLSETHRADAAFGAVERHSGTREMQAGDVEVVPPTHPLHRTVSVFGVDRGLSVFSDGIGEYEVTSSGDVAATLLRATGELSRRDLPERPGHAGWPAAVPDAQCQGTFGAQLGVFLHGPRTAAVLSDISCYADTFVAPPRGETRFGVASRSEVRGIDICGTGLHVAAIKPAESGTGIVVRVENLTPDWQPGRVGLDGLQAAWLARLDERQLAHLPVENERVEFFAEPHAVLSFVLSR